MTTAALSPAAATDQARARRSAALRTLARPYGVPLAWVAAALAAYAVVDELRVWVLFLVQNPGEEWDWWTSIASRGFDTAMWTAFTPLILAVCHRVPLTRSGWPKAVAAHLVAGSALAALSVYLNWRIALAVDAEISFAGMLARIFHANLMSYVVAAAVGHLIFSYRHSRDRALRESALEAQLARAQLHALKMQIEPHFLFNTLNSISQLVYENPAAADEMVASLASLLRLTIEGAAAEVVPLSREVQFLRAYLRIQGTRFQDRLAFRIDVSADAEDALVPPLILQPLVENSIRHGLSGRSAAGRVLVSAEVRAGVLRLEVADDGVGFGEGPGRREGVGLTNTRARLQRLYGAGHRLEIGAGPEGGAVVAIEIPHRTAGDIAPATTGR